MRGRSLRTDLLSFDLLEFDRIMDAIEQTESFGVLLG